MRTCSKHGVGSSDYSLGWTYRIGQKTTEIPEEFGEKRYLIPFFSMREKAVDYIPKILYFFTKTSKTMKK